MYAVSNSLYGEWKLKRALQDMETPAQSLEFFSVDTPPFLLIKVKVIAYIIRDCKGSTFICVHSQYQQNVVLL